EVHVWYLLPDELKDASQLKMYTELLSPSERKTALSMNGEKLQKGAVLSRALLRTTLSRYTDCKVDPRSFEFKKNKFGKPEVLWRSDDSRMEWPLHFNISHTSSLIVCGITMDTPIGIDQLICVFPWMERLTCYNNNFDYIIILGGLYHVLFSHYMAICIEDDSTSSGIQIAPLPLGLKRISAIGQHASIGGIGILLLAVNRKLNFVSNKKESCNIGVAKMHTQNFIITSTNWIKFGYKPYNIYPKGSIKDMYSLTHCLEAQLHRHAG
ncbi:hypothetical protein ACJX0J_005363, partial [Zea mays]